MVYRGKPSRGCVECRRMRKKCDLRPEGCSRCVKGNRMCSGYTSQDELRICDQSSEVAQKATRAREKPRSPGISSPSSSSSGSSISDMSLMSLQSVPTYPDRDNYSMAFFFKNYIVDTGQRKLYIDIPENEHLIASMKACGFAGISKNFSDQSITNIARSRYVRALELTNAAIRDPRQVLRDETLLAILVLLNFETLTGGADRSLEAWEHHVYGAAALLGLRGEDALKRPDARWLTMHVITNITIVCLKQNLPIPPAMHHIHKLAVKYTSEPLDPAFLIQGVNLHVVDFRHAVPSGSFDSLDDIADRAYELDADIMKVLDNPPPWWECEVAGPQHLTPNGLPEFQILHYSQSTAYLWCSVRASRILIHETLLGCLRAAEALGLDTSRFQHQRERSATIVKTVSSEILASMPQYLGYDYSVIEMHKLMLSNTLPASPNVAKVDITTALWSHFKYPMRYQMQDVLETKLPTMRVMGGFGILWPLLSTGIASVATSTVRRFVANVFGILGERYRIDQALVLRGMLVRAFEDCVGDRILV